MKSLDMKVNISADGLFSFLFMINNRGEIKNDNNKRKRGGKGKEEE